MRLGFLTEEALHFCAVCRGISADKLTGQSVCVCLCSGEGHDRWKTVHSGGDDQCDPALSGEFFSAKKWKDNSFRKAGIEEENHQGHSGYGDA